MLRLDHFVLITAGMTFQPKQQNSGTLHFDAHYNHNGAGIKYFVTVIFCVMMYEIRTIGRLGCSISPTPFHSHIEYTLAAGAIHLLLWLCIC